MQRLQRVVVLNKPAVEVIRSQDGPNTLFYLDPPYLPEVRSAQGVFGKYEMTEAQHRELLDVINGVQGMVMLSGYPSKLYDSSAGALDAARLRPAQQRRAAKSSNAA